MSVKWYGEQFSRKLNRKIDRRLRAVGEHYRDAVRRNVGQSSPTPSRPGQYPRKVSGELARSVVLRKASDGVTVAAEAPHAEHVERIRPFMLRTLRAEWLRMVAIFLGR